MSPVMHEVIHLLFYFQIFTREFLKSDNQVKGMNSKFRSTTDILLAVSAIKPNARLGGDDEKSIDGKFFIFNILA